MNNLDKQLKELYKRILDEKHYKNNRTSIPTKSIFGYQIRHKMSEGFPLTTLRKIHTPSMIHELLWFLTSYEEQYDKFGNTNIKYLLDNGVTFWTDWCYDVYKRERLKKHQTNDLKDSKTVKQFKCLSQKEFEKKIIENEEFALQWGDLGPIYGKQWTDWGGHYEMVEKTKEYNSTRANTVIVDKQGWQKIYLRGINQIDGIISELIDNPDSRRLIVNSWNVEELDDMLLMPCHYSWQLYTKIIPIEERFEYIEQKVNKKDITEYLSKNNINTLNDIKRDPRKMEKVLTHFSIPERTLSLMFNQRSVDTYLGLGFNLASYGLLLTMLGQVVNMIPDELVFNGCDVHLYDNSIEATKELLEREIRPLPQLKLNEDIQNIYGFRIEDVNIVGYNPHPNIAVDVAV